MNKKYVSNNILLQIGFIVLILLVFWMIFKNVMIFLPGILSAICLFVILLNPLKWMHEEKKINKTLTVIILLVLSAVLLIGPVYGLINVLIKKIMLMLNDTKAIENELKRLINLLQDQYNIDLFSSTNISKLTQMGTSVLQSILNASMQMIIQLGVAFLLLYFMLMNATRIESAFYEYVPFKNTNLKKMNVELKKQIYSNAIGVPLTAVIQAFVAYLGYLFFGVDDAFTWFLITIFVSMLPVVGTAIVYIPLSIILYTHGNEFEGIGLFLYGVLIVGFSDNLIRFLLQKKMANIHPLITIFGVIIGINLFGVIGIIFGPILFSVFLWLIKLYRAEFVKPNPE